MSLPEEETTYFLLNVDSLENIYNSFQYDSNKILDSNKVIRFLTFIFLQRVKF